MKNKAITRAATAAIKNITAEAINAEAEAWDKVQSFFPKAITALGEYQFMYALCLSEVFGKSDREEPRRLANLLLDVCNRADGNAPVSLTYCWKEEEEMVDTGFFPSDLYEGLDYLCWHAPASFVMLERMDALLPSVLYFPTCPRLLAPATLIRYSLKAVRERFDLAHRAA